MKPPDFVQRNEHSPESFIAPSLAQVFPANHALRSTANGENDLWVHVLYIGARVDLKSPDFTQKVQNSSNLSKAGFPAMAGADEYMYSSGVST